MSENNPERTQMPLSPLQLRDVIPVTLSARRFKTEGEAPNPLQPLVNLSGSTTFIEDDGCEVELRADVIFEGDFRPFEINVNIVGLFAFERTAGDQAEFAAYVQNAASSILMPFLREAVHDLSGRLRIQPPLLLPLIAPALAPATLNIKPGAEEAEHIHTPSPENYRSSSSRPVKRTSGK